MADADTEISLDALHQSILTAISTQFPDMETVDDYRSDRLALPLPACLVNLIGMEPDPDIDPGTGQLAVQARFDARIIIGFRTANAKREIRKLSAALASFVYQNRWGLPVGAAEVISIEQDDFSPELDQYEVWRVEWQQAVHLGESVWDNDGTIPTTVFLGFAPEIGPDYEDAYVEVASPPEEEP